MRDEGQKRNSGGEGGARTNFLAGVGAVTAKIPDDFHANSLTRLRLLHLLRFGAHAEGGGLKLGRP